MVRDVDDIKRGFWNGTRLREVQWFHEALIKADSSHGTRVPGGKKNERMKC